MTKPVSRVLVVDDMPLNRDVLGRRMRREGYEVLEAESGPEALELLAASAVDLVLLDVMMPGMSGLEVLEAIRATCTLSELPVIMVTARDHSEDVVQALALGANDYVVKPVDYPVLQARMRTQLELSRLSRLKDEFLAIASHDLKNPISEILGVAALVEGLAKPGEPLPQQVFGLLGLVGKGARRMQRLIEDFLDGQALADGRLHLAEAEVVLDEVAREAIEANQAYAESKGITVSTASGPGLAIGRGDGRRLAQVVHNLLDNAIKFSQPGTQVVLRTLRRDGWAILEVADGGPGLTEDDLARVFQKYARLSNRPTGGETSTGIGLAQCERLMRAMAGRLAVRNGAEGGAVFWLELPAAG